MNSADVTALPPPIPVEHRPIPWGPWATVALTVLIVAIVFATQSMVGALFVLVSWTMDPAADGAEISRGLGSNGLLLALAGIVSAPVAIAVVWAFTSARRGIDVLDYLGLRAFPIGLTAAWLVVLGGYQIFIVLLAATIQPSDAATSEFMVDAFSTAGIRPLLWLSVIVFLPVSEEVIFRGFMFRGLVHSRFGVAGAILIPAILWGSIHLQYNLFGILCIVGMGIVLGLARYATGSTWTAIAMHMAWNCVAALSTELYIMSSG